MLICELCGDLKDEDEIEHYTQYHPYGESSAGEELMNLDCHCSGQYVKAECCLNCGEYYAEKCDCTKGELK